MRKAIAYLIFIILICSQVFALEVSDLKPNDRVGNMTILVSYPLYKEEETAVLVMQPFESFKDVEGDILIYDSPNADSPKGYDLMVILEKWRTEAQAKHRFDEDFSFEGGVQGFQKCDVEFKGRRIKKCEKAGYPQLVYVFYYQNFLIRLQPHHDYTFTTLELFYLSFDMQKIINNILAKIELLEREPKLPEEEIIPVIETAPEVPAPKEEILTEAQPGFFSRNKYSILGGIAILFILFWMYKTRKFLGVIFIVILGLIIFNRSTVFTQRETVYLAILWIVIYMMVHWFYSKKIKK